MIDKKKLGKKIGTFYFVGRGSLHQYVEGWVIKPNTQEPIMINIKQGHLLSRWMRNKNELYTMQEASEKYKKIVANKI